jgi:hypothetical protein
MEACGVEMTGRIFIDLDILRSFRCGQSLTCLDVEDLTFSGQTISVLLRVVIGPLPFGQEDETFGKFKSRHSILLSREKYENVLGSQG